MPLWKRLLLAVFFLSLIVFLFALVRQLVDRSASPTLVSRSTVAITVAPSVTVTPSPLPTEKASAAPSGSSRLFFLPFARGEAPSPTASPLPSPSPPPPAPTPTPTLPWPDPLVRPSRSKLGLHVQWNNSPEIMEFVRRMRPRVLKVLGDLGFVSEVKEASPETIVIARLNHPQPMEGDPEAMARAFVQAHLETYLQHPAVDYWEGYNEPDVKGKMEWYARFEAERVRAMAEYGLRAAIGGFSTGVPEWDEFEAFLPAIAVAQEHGGILTLHEYDAPLMDRSFGAGLPGRPNYPDRGALTLRYRWWYEDFLKPRGLVIPLVISEAGIDGHVGNRPGPPEARGWQDFASYWREQGLGGDPLMVYLEQLKWYDSELQKDDYVIGWALFTAGAMDYEWRSYDVTDYLRHIATYIIVPNAQ